MSDSIIKPPTQTKAWSDEPYPAIHLDATRLIDAVNVLRGRGEPAYATNCAEHLGWSLGYVDKVKRHIIDRLYEDFELDLEVPWTVMAGERGGIAETDDQRLAAIAQVRKGHRSRNENTFKRIRIEFCKHPTLDTLAHAYAEAAYHQGRDVYGEAYREIQKLNLEALLNDGLEHAAAIERSNRLLGVIAEEYGVVAPA